MESPKPNIGEDSVTTRAQESATQETVVIEVDEPATPAATSTSGWKMEPVRLPSDMELVETRPNTQPVSDEEATVELKPRPSRRPARAKPAASPSVESLVQIETRKEQETDNADNR